MTDQNPSIADAVLDEVMMLGIELAAVGIAYNALYFRLTPALKAKLDDTEPSETPSKPDEKPELAHTETQACWCRKKPASRENVWCKLRKAEKPASEHAALRTTAPRADRYKVTRMVGTRY